MLFSLVKEFKPRGKFVTLFLVIVGVYGICDQYLIYISVYVYIPTIVYISIYV